MAQTAQDSFQLAAIFNAFAATDWTILLASIVAAALHLGSAHRRMDLLRDLHEMQKHEAYGDSPPEASTRRMSPQRLRRTSTPWAIC